MFANSDRVEPVILITIVCESVLKDSVIGLLKNLKVRGHTIGSIQGEDRLGNRFGGAEEHPDNIEIKALVSQEISDVILHTLQKHRGDHAVMVYRQSVEAMID